MQKTLTMRRLAWIGLALSAAACANLPEPSPIHPTPVVTTPPPPRLASVYGHGAYHARSGAHGACAGQSVALMRDTPKFRARIAAIYESTEHALQPVRAIQARTAKLGSGEESPLAASVQCDANSTFEFHGLAPGSYFIIARVKQALPGHPPVDYVDMQHVIVGPGQTVDVRLAP